MKLRNFTVGIIDEFLAMIRHLHLLSPIAVPKTLLTLRTRKRAKIGLIFFNRLFLRLSFSIYRTHIWATRGRDNRWGRQLPSSIARSRSSKIRLEFQLNVKIATIIWSYPLDLDHYPQTGVNFIGNKVAVGSSTNGLYLFVFLFVISFFLCTTVLHFFFALTISCDTNC